MDGEYIVCLLIIIFLFVRREGFEAVNAHKLYADAKFTEDTLNDNPSKSSPELNKYYETTMTEKSLIPLNQELVHATGEVSLTFPMINRVSKFS